MKYGSYLITAAIPFIGILTMLAPAGCASESPTPRVPSSSHSVIRTTVHVLAGEGPEAAKLSERLAVALSHAGHEVVSSEASAHVLAAEVTVTLRESRSLLQVRVNGKVKQNYVAEATLRVRGGSQVLSGEHLEYDVDDGPSEEQIRKLVLTTRSPSVQTYLQQIGQQQKAAHTRAQQEERDREAARAREQLWAQKEQEQMDDAAWNQLVMSECTTPTQLTGCDGAKQYLAQYPHGRHIVEAKKALEAGMPVIARLSDERDWGSSRFEACKSPRESTDCDSVSAYIQGQPAGVHIAEARELLAQAESKLRALRITEEQKSKAEQAKTQREAEKAEQAQQQAERRQAREACKKDCIGNSCFNLRPGVFEICLDRCIKANCD
jgi:hypothetical protein